MVVLGFNSSDDAGLALDFMKENGFTFRTVLDSSDEAGQVAWGAYKACCVPLHYVIDKERKIALAQPGFEEGYTTILGTLARLGVDTGVDPLPETPVEQQPAKRGWEDPSEEDADTERIEPCSLSGKVLDADHQPLSGRALEVFSREHDFDKRVKTNDEGVYFLDGLKPGHYAVHATTWPKGSAGTETVPPADRFQITRPAHWLKMEQIEPGQAATIDFVPVKDAAILAGEVRGPEGNPLSGCRVVVSNIRHCRKEGYQPFTVRISTDSSGRFAVHNLNPGTYETTVSKSGEISRSPTGEVILAKGEKKEILLSISPGKVCGWIEVEGDPHPDSDYPWVVASPAGDRFGSHWSVKAFSFSAFEIQNLPPGDYEVWAQLRGFVCAPQRFTVRKDGTADRVEITLKPGGSILFEVTDRNGSPIENASITTVIPGKGSIDADTEKISEGLFRVHSVEYGETRFRIRSSGRGEEELTVTVEEGIETALCVMIG